MLQLRSSLENSPLVLHGGISRDHILAATPPSGEDCPVHGCLEFGGYVCLSLGCDITEPEANRLRIMSPTLNFASIRGGDLASVLASGFISHLFESLGEKKECHLLVALQSLQ